MRNLVKVGMLAFAFAIMFISVDTVSAQRWERRNDSSRREYRRDVREARRDYQRRVNNGDYRKARREYREDIRDARREYRDDNGRRYNSNRRYYRPYNSGGIRIYRRW